VERWTGPAAVGIGGFRAYVDTTRPAALDAYRSRAELAHSLRGDGDGYAFVALAAPDDSDLSLVVEGTFAVQGGRGPGVLIVPPTQQVFIGTGATLTAFDRRGGRWSLTWTDEAEAGFWDWSQHGDVVLMAAELELAVWSSDGVKLWSRFVEPPWSYSVHGSDVHLDVMGTESLLSLRDGR
jgi:hypothetical protein